MVAYQASDPEVLGLIPAATGNWAFSLSSLFSFLNFNQWYVLNQVPCGGATLLVFNFPRKMTCLAAQLEAMQALHALQDKKVPHKS